MMTPRRCCLALALVAVTAGGVQASAQAAPDSALAAKIEALLTDPVAARAHWGIVVTDLDGKQIYGLDETKLFRPASTAKLFTTAAAMALMGPKATVKTVVRGEPDDAGVVHGKLYLEGGGDANLDSNDLPYVFRTPRQRDAAHPFPDLESLADQLVAKGVKKIDGDIEANTDDFPWEPYPEGWEADDFVWGYAAPVCGLSIADNQLKLTTSPGAIVSTNREKSYSSPTIQLEQNGVPYYKLNSLGLMEESKEYWSGVNVDRELGSRVLRVYGHIAVDSKPDIEEVAINDPALYAAMAFRIILQQKGIVVTGEATSYHWQLNRGDNFLSQLRDPGSCANHMYPTGKWEDKCSTARLETLIPILASHESPSLAEDVDFTLKASQNLHAELILRQLGRYALDGNASNISGARVVRQFLLHAGIDANDFDFYDGSGLSTKDLVTPRAEAQLLAFAMKQTWFAAWKAGLPVGGVDGTLAERFKEPPLKGHVFAKTGTLGESRALAGYLDCASGRQVIFSILVDNHPPGTSADKDVMDKIVAAIAAAE